MYLCKIHLALLDPVITPKRPGLPPPATRFKRYFAAGAGAGLRVR